MNHPIFIGGRTAIRLKPLYSCPVCSGKGKVNDAKTKEMRECVACKGTGIITKKIIE